MQTHLVSKIMHQNLAVTLQFYYGKNSFIVLIPGGTTGRTTSRAADKPPDRIDRFVDKAEYVFLFVKRSVL